MNAPDAPVFERITLYDHRHVRRQRGKALSHIVPAFVLLTTALATLSGAEQLSAVTMLEFVVGAAYVLLMVREMRHLKQHPHHTEKVAWLELAAAGILALEGYHIWHRHHEADLRRGTPTFHLLPYLYYAVAGFFIFLAFTVSRIHQRRHLHLHADGFGGRLRLWGPAFGFKWADVATVEPSGPADVVVHRTDGTRQQFSFAHLHDGAAHRDRLVAHARRRQQEGGPA
ncbi:hypothetical protein E5K00_00210 [Hymenobacter aquaticus]|uniref:Uncharacterized protein n=1 Tax=Hymenobacter aquaticus TaxID=1867101 RepID=A0A4Z0Q0V5_9BACT|nr:hypothetical protein [Hymenobacter aquaticus]TGE23670.1 hypothetical protein E5K00_00210 [Hymenobacter aquaticus]